jgi:hypothetical protein
MLISKIDNLKGQMTSHSYVLGAGTERSKSESKVKEGEKKSNNMRPRISSSNTMTPWLGKSPPRPKKSSTKTLKKD